MIGDTGSWHGADLFKRPRPRILNPTHPAPPVARRRRRLRRRRLLTTGHHVCRSTGQDDCRRPRALAEPEEARASPQQTRQDRRRIKELEREVHRKDRALAETAALLVLSRKLEAVFNDKGEAE